MNNELACHVQADYSDESAAAFREWLRAQYGTIEALNTAWGTAFWSPRYTGFDEITPPRTTTTFLDPTQSIDFERFSSDAWRDVLQREIAILREVTPNIPITTNFMGSFKDSDYMGFFKDSDYRAWATELDFVSNDDYIDPADPDAPVSAAASRDLMRSLKSGPWILMEQATPAVNWRPTNVVPPHGMHRLISLQAIARGAHGIMQFRWRQSRAGAEKFHSAMLPHAGTDTRGFRQTVALGHELATLSDIAHTRQHANVAIIFDWDSWWVLEQQAPPAQVCYLEILMR